MHVTVRNGIELGLLRLLCFVQNLTGNISRLCKSPCFVRSSKTFWFPNCLALDWMEKRNLKPEVTESVAVRLRVSQLYSVQGR